MDEPGTYLRELQRALDMPMGALEYHLDQLEQAGLVSVLHGENKRFFPARMGAEDKRGLALLRQEGPRRIVIELLERGDATNKELVSATGFPSSTVSYYTGKLADAGMLDRTRSGRESHHTLTDPERAYSLLVRYRTSFLDRVLDGFLASFDAVRLRDSPEEDA